MSNTLIHAKKEIDILLKKFENSEDSLIIEPFIPEILALVEKFGNSGQSGGSAPYTANAISQTVKKLCMFETLSEITGDDEEWISVSDSVFQNNRCYSIFKESPDFTPYYLDAIVWKTQDGNMWCGSAKDLETGEEYNSRQFIKQFPFSPKTFYIDVIEEEVTKGNWEFYIKDINQFDDAKEYYDVRSYSGEEKN